MKTTRVPIILPDRSPPSNVAGGAIHIQIDPMARQASQRVFGIACLQTNASVQKLSTTAVMAWHRRKNRVDEA